MFLAIGLLAGEDGLLGIEFDNSYAAYFIGSLALAIILFDSGFETRLRSYRVAGVPAIVLATLGVLLTAALLGAAAKFLLNVSWTEAFLLGSIVASTDAAAVFFLLRVGGIRLRDKVTSTLEIESGVNDPMAIFLTLALTQLAAVASTDTVSVGADIVITFFQQIGIGVLFGLVGGFGIAWMLNALRNLDPGLYPITGLAAALVVFGACSLLGGSGFLAAYLAGVIAGNRRVRFAVRLRRFQVGMTWLAQIGMFLTLGLLATPSEMPALILPGLLLAAFLIFIARPLAVWLCLLPFGYRARDKAFIGWVGLRGAVSIMLAIIPALYQLENARFFFNIVFVMVLASLLVQGWTIAPVSRLLRLNLPPESALLDRVELELRGAQDIELVGYRIHPESALAQGGRIPRWARPTLVIRDGDPLSIHTVGQLQPNDQVYLFASPRRIRLLDKIYAQSTEIEQPIEDVDYRIKGQTSIAALTAQYDAALPASRPDQTLADYLDQAFNNAPVVGDRIGAGLLDIVVCGLDEQGRVSEVGIALLPEQTGLRQVASDLLTALRMRLPGRRPAPEARARNEKGQVAVDPALDKS